MINNQSIENQAKFEINELLAIFGSDNVFISPDVKISSVSTDTRQIKPNSLFVALIGENYDAHNYINQAFTSGASVCIVENKWFDDNKDNHLNQNFIIVKDTLVALQELANFHRLRFEIDIIAVAGSNGKTTTKEMIADLLATKYNVLRTIQNYNNQVGAALMLLQINEDTEMAVIEIGTNYPSEVHIITEMVAPTSGLITNIGKEHLEGFGDLDGVELEETSLYAFLKKSDAMAFVNMDDERLIKYSQLFDNKYTYGQSTENDLNLNAKYSFDENFNTSIDFYEKQHEQHFNINLAAKGLNFAYNAVAAVAIAYFYKIPIENIKQVLENWQPDSSSSYARMGLLQKNNIILLNDTYNANPSSTELALKTLTLTKNGWTKIALLGDMLELGEESTSEHKQIIKIALEFSNYTYLYGDNYTQAYNELGLNLNNIKVFSDKIEMYNYAKEKIQPNTIILVKGSRGKKMEEISESIKKDFLD